MRNLGDAEVRHSLQRRIAALPSDAQSRWGLMSAHQMLCHLSDSFRVCTGDKRATVVANWVTGTAFKWIALYVPAPWPKNVPTRPEVKQGAGGTPPADFEQDRADLLVLLDRFCCPRQRTPHPFFGNMREREWLRWAYLHVDHHLRQFGV
jgi:hypothetical protein